MTQGFDVAGELADGVGDRAGAWRFVEGFARSWARPLGDGDGWGEAELAAAERRLGITLPLALREAYRLFGRREDLTGNHDVLLSPADLYLDERGEVLVFRHENQGAASWGVVVDDPERSDPAVVIRADLADKAAEKWEGWLDRFSLACVETVLSESLHAPEGWCDFLGELGPDGAESLAEGGVRLRFADDPGREPFSGSRWYLGPDALLRLDGGVTLLARGRTQEALDRVREWIPGEWLNGWA